MSRSAVKKTEKAPRCESEQFLENLDSIIQALDPDEGHMRGSLSNESWKMFLQSVRGEILARLKEYGAEKDHFSGFATLNLNSYREERKKIERVNLRNLVTLYNRANKTYKAMCG